MVFTAGIVVGAIVAWLVACCLVVPAIREIEQITVTARAALHNCSTSGTGPLQTLSCVRDVASNGSRECITGRIKSHGGPGRSFVLPTSHVGSDSA